MSRQRKNKELKDSRKEDLNRIRGARKIIDPEQGPENRK